MGVEIERRFMVNPAHLPKRLPLGKRLLQGFLSLNPVVRVRLATATQNGKRTTQATLTIKGPGLRTRAEFEFPLPFADATAMLRICGDVKIEKVRTVLGPWEIDRYLGRFKGLWLAEIELPSVHTPLPDPLPAWIGPEVTENPRYTNARLVRMKTPPKAALRFSGSV